ncbi:putative phage membrane protein [Staphylococcus epidermidis]|nr:putative phage membrane protein [Staphylococcus epidermidis]
MITVSMLLQFGLFLIALIGLMIKISELAQKNLPILSTVMMCTPKVGLKI